MMLRSPGGINDVFRQRKSQRWEGWKLEEEAWELDCPLSPGRCDGEDCVMRILLRKNQPGDSSVWE